MDRIALSASVQLPARPESAADARRLIKKLCNAASLGEDQCATAALLTSELVTNAIRYGGSTVKLDAEVPGTVLRVSVRDDSPDLPKEGIDPDVTDEGGRGLLLVSTLASRWGVERSDNGGKAVWFELRISSPSA